MTSSTTTDTVPPRRRRCQRVPSAGEPTRWFDELWSAAERDEIEPPWDRTEPSDVVAAHVDAVGPGAGRRAVVVGAGLGADASRAGTLLAVQFVRGARGADDGPPCWVAVLTRGA